MGRPRAPRRTPGRHRPRRATLVLHDVGPALTLDAPAGDRLARRDPRDAAVPRRQAGADRARVVDGATDVRAGVDARHGEIERIAEHAKLGVQHAQCGRPVERPRFGDALDLAPPHLGTELEQGRHRRRPNLRISRSGAMITASPSSFRARARMWSPRLSMPSSLVTRMRTTTKRYVGRRADPGPDRRLLAPTGVDRRLNQNTSTSPSVTRIIPGTWATAIASPSSSHAQSADNEG